MGLISYRPLRAEDADAVFDAAREAWRFTYATIFDTVFIDQFVRTNYAPDRLSALVPAVAAQHMFLDVALDGDRIIGFERRGRNVTRLCHTSAAPAHSSRARASRHSALPPPPRGHRPRRSGRCHAASPAGRHLGREIG
jgi:hypothetical protein